jgi:hypothetical protein
MKDDFHLRMYDTGFCVSRPDNTSTPTLIRLDLENERNPEEDPNAFSRLSQAITKQYDDGLFNIKKLTKIVEIKLYKTFTHLSVVDI